MPNNAVVNSNVLVGVIFAVLATVSSLASCGGSVGNTPLNTTTVIAFATPPLVASGSSSIITWSSTNSTSCTSSPVGISGTAGQYTTPSITATTTYTITCVGPTGSASQRVIISVAPNASISTILSVVATYSSMPVVGTTYYYCDCGTGASAGCVAGSDSKAGVSPSAPRQTIADAASRMRSVAGSPFTVALCKGGAFNALGALSVGSSTCAAGTTCNDLREYTPTTFTGIAKPIINNVAGATNLFTFNGNVGGVRVMNIALQGDGSSGNRAFFFYNGAHDVTVGNVDMSTFDIPFYNEPAGTMPNTNIKLTGSYIVNSTSIGYLGSGNYSEISYNYWESNGTTIDRDHTIYLSAHVPVSNINVIGNYIHGQRGPSCNGAPLVGHGTFDYLSISNNTVVIDPAAATGACWGISFGNGGYTTAYQRHTAISGNTIINGGNLALSVSSCPNCLIRNNLIIQDWAYGSSPGVGNWSVIGIGIPVDVARIGVDDINNGNVIVNNTIWFGPNSTGGATGIRLANEGTGHILANNTISYSSSTAGQGVNCFDYPLALTAYSFINNNHCYSAATFKWEKTNGPTLSAWRTYSGFDSLSIIGPPIFTNPGSGSTYDFHPNTGSPLLGSGSPLYAPTTTTDITGTPFLNPPAIGAYE
ncbi:hypothetical protein GALL_180080 [mine drainage metagenome]|uniref:Right handed beta helix domain-containing protein n=1 Tax=mine drainage metagenome TaxID=410659 RepID=A0A1J5RUP3_9ZZZZ